MVCSLSTVAMKPTVVLVHGAFETADVWRPVEGQLRQSGYETIAVTLPGRTGNPLPPAEATLALYRDTILGVMSPEKRPVVLVGHSLGGMAISAVAEAQPDMVKALVYVAAYLPRDGQSLLTLSRGDANSRLEPTFRRSSDKATAVLDPARAAELFYNGCPSQIRATFVARMVPEPWRPLAEPVSLTPERFGAVSKAYVRTSKDLVVSPALQAAMTAATPVRQSITLKAGHAALMTLPRELARAIARAAH
jgi:pimeloyl-ACP methyl ester carboxylesterase